MNDDVASGSAWGGVPPVSAEQPKPRPTDARSPLDRRALEQAAILSGQRGSNEQRAVRVGELDQLIASLAGQFQLEYQVPIRELNGKISNPALLFRNAGLSAPEIVNVLPVAGNFVGRLVFLTDDNKIYRWTGTEWTAAIPAVDITGAITAEQIEAEVTDAIAAAQTNANAADQKASQVRADHDALVAGFTGTLNDAFGAISADINGISSDIAGVQAAVNADIASINTSIGTVGASITTLQGEVRVEIDGLRGAYEDSAASINSELDVVKQDITTFQSALTDVQVDLIAVYDSATGQVKASALSGYYTASGTDSAIAAQISSLSATILTPAGQVRSTLLTGYYTKAEADQVVAASISSLDVQFDGLTAAINNEAIARASADTAEVNARQSLATQLRGNYTGTSIGSVSTGLIHSERQARITADSNLQSQINTLVAASSGDFGSLFAAIEEESTARIEADTALAGNFSSLTARLDNILDAGGAPTNKTIEATINDDRIARVNADSALAGEITNLTATVANNDTATNAAISGEALIRANADTALAGQIDTLTATVTGNNTATNAAITAANTARADGDSALAASQQTLRSQVAATTIPRDFQSDGLYWFTGFGGDPATVPDLSSAAYTTFPVVEGGGKVLRITKVSGNSGFSPKAVLPYLPNRTYRLRLRARCVTKVGGGTGRVSVQLRRFNSAFSSTGILRGGSLDFSALNEWQDYELSFTSPSSVGSDVYFRPFIFHPNSTSFAQIGDVYEYQWVEIADITDVQNVTANLETSYYTKTSTDTAIAASNTELRSEMSLRGNSGNLIPNGSFVTGDFSQWTPFNSTTFDQFKIVARGANTSGAVMNAPTAFIMEILQSADTNQIRAVSNVPVIPGEVLQANMDIATGGGAPRDTTGSLRFIFRFVDGSSVTTWRAFSANSTGWSRTDFDNVIVPVNAISLDFDIRRNGGGSGSGYITNIRLNKQTETETKIAANLETNYYTKVSTDTAIAAAQTALQSSIDGVSSNLALSYYTKVQVDSALSAITNTLQSNINGVSSDLANNYYTKAATDSAIAAVNTSLSSQISNNVTATAAAQAAANAANTLAGGKGKVIIQNAAPAAADRLPQNLWIDTTGGANTPKRWVSGTTWAAVTDKAATDAAAAAAAAQTSANTISANLDTNYYTKTAADQATAAATTSLRSEITNRRVALLPYNFQENLADWTLSRTGSPSNAAPASGQAVFVPDDPNFGPSVDFTTTNAGHNLLTRNTLSGGKQKYRVSVRFKTISASGNANAQYTLSVISMNQSYVQSGSSFPNLGVFPVDGEVHEAQIVVSGEAGYGVDFVSSKMLTAAHIRIGFRNNNNFSNTVRIQSFKIEDVTDLISLSANLDTNYYTSVQTDSVVAAAQTALRGEISNDIEAEINDVLALNISPSSALATSLTNLTSRVGNAESSVTAQGSAIADLEGNASAGYLIRAQAGGAVSLLDLVAADGTSGSVSVAKIQATEIILDGSVTATSLASNSITSAKISADAVTAVKVAAGAITADKVAANAITADKIAANTITGNKIAANTITGGLLAATGIITQTAQIGDGLVDNAKIKNLAVDTLKIKDASVTVPGVAGSAAVNNNGPNTLVAGFDLQLTSGGFVQGILGFRISAGVSIGSYPSNALFFVTVNGQIVTQLPRGSVNERNSPYIVQPFTRSVSAGLVSVQFWIANCGGFGVAVSNLFAIASMK